jgi:hypothetical protein
MGGEVIDFLAPAGQNRKDTRPQILFRDVAGVRSSFVQPLANPARECEVEAVAKGSGS